jgi:hypothetical protein
VNDTVQQASDGKISASVAQFDGTNHLGRTKSLSSPSAKKFSLFFSGKSVAFAVRPVPKRGVGHRHERWNGMVDAATSSRA